MKKFWKNRCAWCILALLAATVFDASAQDRYMRMARELDRPRAFHEAVVVPGGAAAQAAVVSFRIPNNLLVFVQQDDRFTAHPEVVVELFRGGSKIDEAVWRGEHSAPSFDASQDALRDVEGRVVFDVDPGEYTYTLSLTGDGARARGMARTSFLVPDFTETILGRPFFGSVSEGPEDGLQLDLANVGGGVPFGENVSMQVPMATAREGDRLTYRLHRIRQDVRRDRGRRGPSDPDEFELDENDKLVREGVVDLAGAAAVGALESGCLCWRGGGPNRMVPVNLDTGSLENGTYLLEVELAPAVQSGGSRLSARKIFETVWRDMPLSLYDPEVAIRKLEFIESRDRIREMLRGSRMESIERFQAYWDRRDPSPGTPFNELMAEYYRRIDAAAVRFQTGKTPYADGLRTDAARIYVVHGPPDDVSNSFPSSGGVEQVWTYPDGRQFVFWAASSLDALELQEERGASANGS